VANVCTRFVIEGRGACMNTEAATSLQNNISEAIIEDYYDCIQTRLPPLTPLAAMRPVIFCLLRVKRPLVWNDVSASDERKLPLEIRDCGAGVSPRNHALDPVLVAG
jgi:hypothetical protein